MTATVLEATAGQLRKLSGADEQEEETVAETAGSTDEAPATTTTAKPKHRPAPATRTRIANPKAAKKVRARET